MNTELLRLTLEARPWHTWLGSIVPQSMEEPWELPGRAQLEVGDAPLGLQGLWG